jgi:hypothetical protein
VRLISREYGIPIPELRFYRFPEAFKNVVARASGYPAVIEFNSRVNAITAMLIAHEMSHLVCMYYGHEDDSSDHDRVWLAVYLRILNDYAILPLSATQPSLRQYDIDHACPHCAKPDNFWEYDGE